MVYPYKKKKKKPWLNLDLHLQNKSYTPWSIKVITDETHFLYKTGFIYIYCVQFVTAETNWLQSVSVEMTQNRPSVNDDGG